MLRPKLSSREPEQNGINSIPHELSNGVSPVEIPSSESLDIQQEINRLEETILSSFRIPLTRRTLVDEEKLLDLLDLIRMSLPQAFAEAGSIIQQKEEILLEAEEYGQRIVDAAQAKRAQILDENDIIHQAEREAEQMHRKVQQECDAMMQETLQEIDLKRRQCQQELEEMRQRAVAEAQQIEQGADDYADSVLEHIEEDLNEMTRIIRNGRQQLNPNGNTLGNKK
jgi:cell division septum initiation protein DivIVA